MGYDVSFHPISQSEMDEWYFTPLNWVKLGQEEKVLKLANRYGMEPFYAQKYFDTLRVGADTGEDELFDKSHGFYLACDSGLFSHLLLYQGECLFFLSRAETGIWAVLYPWEQLTPLPPSQIRQKTGLWRIIAPGYTYPQSRWRNFSGTWRKTPQVHADLESLWSCGQLAVLKKALTVARKLGCGLLEATEVVEPNPIRPNESESYSNLYHCDRDGIFLYIDTVVQQIKRCNGYQ